MADSLFKKVPVKVVNRSGFDKSFRNLLTTKCGTLTPLLCDEVIPNTDGRIRIAISAQLPPLASETFMNVNLKTEAFFCPTRLLMQGFEQWIKGNTDIKVMQTSNGEPVNGKLRAPVIEMANDAIVRNLIGPGSLSDYLGFGGFNPSSFLPSETYYLNAFPYLAYHLIWDEFYRNALVQKSCFDEDSYKQYAGYQPMSMKYKKPNSVTGYITSIRATLADGVMLGELRQRNFGLDYFTSATPSPQNGKPMGIGVYSGGDSDSGSWNFGASPFSPSDEQDSSSPLSPSVFDGNFPNKTISGFTIAALRSANSLQQFEERQNLAPRLVDFVKVNYNANLRDSIAQRPVYLGSASYPVYSKGVYANSNEDESSNNNPFTSVGSRYGHAFAEGNDFVCDFHVDEPGYIMVLVSLVPEVTYSSGVSRMLTRYVDEDSYTDLANPILQNVGPQPIYSRECNGALIIDSDNRNHIFGYTDRFADFMVRSSELHGLVRDTQSLESFALQRSFTIDTVPEINDSFLKIPVNYMDQVTAVDGDISNYGVWIDSYIDYKVVMPLQRYCIPSLQDPAYEHGDTVVAMRGGQRIE